MKFQVGDLFVVKTRNQEFMKILVLERVEPLPTNEEHYKIEIYYPDGNIKKQYLDLLSIKFYVKNDDWKHYPVVK